MEREIDLATANRDVLIGIIVRQQAVIEGLERRVAQLEGQSKSKGWGRMPGLKPKADQKPGQKPGQPEKSGKEPRKPRRHGFARQRMAPTQRVEHVVEECPGCGTRLSGGWTQRTREVIDLPQVPVQVTEHVYMARTCPLCQLCCVPPAQLEGVVLGKQRLGVNLVSLIAALREEARLPFRTIQWYLDTVHGLHLSLGALVDATRRVAAKAQTELAGIVERIRGSPVVHADETPLAGGGGERLRVDARPPAILPAAGTGQGVVDEVLGEEFAGGWPALRRLPPLQRCWAHLLRDIAEGPLPQRNWAEAARCLLWHSPILPNCPLLALCPFLDDSSGQGYAGAWRSTKELFVFVAHPEVPPDNNAAEEPAPAGDQPQDQRGHALRAGQGTMALASIFGGGHLNPLTSCRQLLASPQI